MTLEDYTDTTKSIWEIIQKFNKEERFLYQNNDEGTKKVIDRYNDILDQIDDGLNKAFDIRPKASMEVKRVPEFKEAGAAHAYYEQPLMDRSRGVIFYANLRDITETVKFGMKTLAYHEGIPGYHFHVAI